MEELEREEVKAVQGQRTLVKGLVCPRCRQFVYSRAHHDMRSCKCGAVSVDGGFEYFRALVDPELGDQVFMEETLVDATKIALFVDWNTRQTKFGVIDL